MSEKPHRRCSTVLVDLGYGSTAGSSQGGCAELLCLNACLYCSDEPTVLESDSGLEDGDDNLNNTRALRTLDAATVAAGLVEGT
jgi:hypothetical protein